MGPISDFFAKYTGASMEILTLLCILSSRLYVGSSPQSSYDLRFLHVSFISPVEAFSIIGNRLL